MYRIERERYSFIPQTTSTIRRRARDRHSGSAQSHVGPEPPAKTQSSSNTPSRVAQKRTVRFNDSASDSESDDPVDYDRPDLSVDHVPRDHRGTQADESKTETDCDETGKPRRSKRSGTDSDSEERPPESGGMLHSDFHSEYNSRIQSIFTFRKAMARKHVKLEKADSRDFDPIESGVWQQHAYRNVSERQARVISVTRWLLTALVAVATGFVAIIVIYGADYLTYLKFYLTGYALYGCSRPPCNVNASISDSMLYGTNTTAASVWEEKTNRGAAFAVYLLVCLAFTFIASLLVGVMAPVALGSGIPEILMILNGIKVPNGLRFKTLVAKVGGIIFTVAGGMPVGREGPMIHAAAIMAAGVSQGMSTSIPGLLCQRLTCFSPFRNDIEKRDFITCGTAAGVAAAFGAPIGGVLFALEEGASFWYRQLTWRALLCSFMAIFVLGMLQSTINVIGDDGASLFGELSLPGMFNFGSYSLYNSNGNNNLASYNVWELPIFMMMGVFGGLQGGLFCFINTRVSAWRKKNIRTIPRRLTEVALVCTLMAIVSFTLPCLPNRCVQIHAGFKSPDTFQIETEMARFGCPPGSFNDLAALFLNPPEKVIKLLFHYPPGFSWSACVIFFGPYFIFTCLTNGLHIPGSVFIPSLLFGSAFGRAVGFLVTRIVPAGSIHADAGTYALVGAACCLGGSSRITISLAVIMMETTGNLQYGLPLVVSLFAAQWIGNLLTEGLYDIKIHLTKTAFIHEDIPQLANQLRACDVMVPRLKTLPPMVQVRELVSLLMDTRHNGFPVVEQAGTGTASRKRKLLGLVLRKHLSVVLSLKAFVKDKPSLDVPINERVWMPKLLWHHLECMYPVYPEVAGLHLDDEDMEKWVDLTPYMNPAPYVVQEHATLRRAFQLFRTMGLRHLLVVDSAYCLRGMISRHNLTHHHIEHCVDNMFSGKRTAHTGSVISERSTPNMLPAFVRSLDTVNNSK